MATAEYEESGDQEEYELPEGLTETPFAGLYLDEEDGVLFEYEEGDLDDIESYTPHDLDEGYVVSGDEENGVTLGHDEEGLYVEVDADGEEEREYLGDDVEEAADRLENLARQMKAEYDQAEGPDREDLERVNRIIEEFFGGDKGLKMLAGAAFMYADYKASKKQEEYQSRMKGFKELQALTRDVEEGEETSLLSMVSGSHEYEESEEEYTDKPRGGEDLGERVEEVTGGGNDAREYLAGEGEGGYRDALDVLEYEEGEELRDTEGHFAGNVENLEVQEGELGSLVARNKNTGYETVLRSAADRAEEALGAEEE